jgi:HK97 gp10 family phage protein
MASFAAVRARFFAAVDTGHMQESTEKFDDARGIGVQSYGGRDGRAYARFVEFGTRRNAAQPFLRPAGEDAVTNLPSQLGGFARELVG